MPSQSVLMCKEILQIGGGKLAVTIISGAELDLFLSIVFRSDIVLLEKKLAEHFINCSLGWMGSFSAGIPASYAERKTTNRADT